MSHNHYSDQPSEQSSTSQTEMLQTTAPLSSAKINHSIRLPVLPIAITAGSVIVNIAYEKWAAGVPNWLFIILCIVTLSLWFYWAWTHETIKRWHRLIYTHPIMSFTIMVIIGACAGGGIGALLWWSAYRQQPAVSTINQGNLSPPTPSPASLPTKEASVALTPRPTQSEQRPLQASPLTSPLDLSFPLVVEIVVDMHKQFHIVNKGKVSITDIEVTDTKYLFNRKAWDEKRLEIEQVSKSGGPFLKIPEVRAESSSSILNLSQNNFFDFEDFEDLTKKPDEDFYAAQRRNYCFRVTFRDGRTGQKYVMYKVTSSIKGGPGIFENLETTARGGPPRRIFLEDIPEVIISDQRLLYKNDEVKEYKP